MATFTYITNANVAAGNTAPDSGRDAIIIVPETINDVVTFGDIEAFLVADATIVINKEFALSSDSVSTAIGFYHHAGTQTAQLQNLYLMWGPGVIMDMENYNVTVFDNAFGTATGRAAGLNFGGAEGPNTLVTPSVNNDVWEAQKAVLNLKNTSYRMIRNVGVAGQGNSGSRGCGSIVLALNGEVLFDSNSIVIGGGSATTAGTGGGNAKHGIGMHPQAGANESAGVQARGINGSGWSQWSNNNIVGGGFTPTSDRAVALLKGGTSLPVWTPVSDGSEVLLTSPRSEGLGATMHQMRFNVTGSFGDGVTLNPSEFNVGGGNYNIATDSLGYVNQGVPRFVDQTVFEGSLTDPTGQVVISARGDSMTFDGFDFGDRGQADFTIDLNSPAATGHFDAFKRLSYTVIKSGDVSDVDAPIGGTGTGRESGLFRSFIRADTFNTNSRFIQDSNIIGSGTANFTAAGTLAVTQENITNPATTHRSYSNVEANQAFVFEGVPQTELRVPYVGILSNTNLGQSKYETDRLVNSYIQYPFNPIIETINPMSSLDYVQTFVETLIVSSFIGDHSAARVSALTTLLTTQQMIDRFYMNDLEALKLQGSSPTDESVLNSLVTSHLLNTTSFHLFNSTPDSLVATANITFQDTVQDLITFDGNTLEIQAPIAFTGSMLSQGTIQNSAGSAIINHSAGTIDAGTIVTTNFIFNQSTLDGNLSGTGRLNGVTHQGGTATISSTTDLVGRNTFNSLVNTDVDIVDQNFGSGTITSTAPYTTNWTGNEFDGTSLLLDIALINDGLDFTGWNNTGVLVLTSGNPVTVSINQSQSTDFTAAGGVTLLLVAETHSYTEVVPQPGTVAVYKVNGAGVADELINTTTTLVVDEPITFNYNDQGNTITVGDSLRIYYIPTDFRYSGGIEEVLLVAGGQSHTLSANAVNAQLLAPTTYAVIPTVSAEPSGSTAGDNLGMLISISENINDSADTQRAFLLATKTSEYLSTLIRINEEAEVGATLTFDLIVASSESITVDSEYVRLTSTDISTPRNVFDVLRVDTLSWRDGDFVVLTTGGVIVPLVTVEASPTANLARIQSVVRAETGSLASRQDLANATLAGVVTEDGAVVTPLLGL